MQPRILSYQTLPIHPPQTQVTRLNTAEKIIQLHDQHQTVMVYYFMVFYEAVISSHITQSLRSDVTGLAQIQSRHSTNNRWHCTLVFLNIIQINTHDFYKAQLLTSFQLSPSDREVRMANKNDKNNSTKCECNVLSNYLNTAKCAKSKISHY